jgi:hypothetical protein
LKEILSSSSFLSKEFFTYILMVFVVLHLLLHHLGLLCLCWIVVVH